MQNEFNSRKKRSILWKIQKEDLQFILDTSNSFKEVLEKFNCTTSCGMRITLNKVIDYHKLTLEKLILNRNKYVSETTRKNVKTIPSEDVFCENSNIDRSTLRKHILRHKKINYICSICLNYGEWNGNKLTLQVDHINGNNKDHRIENLRYLCPNCHSQTPTYGVKNFNNKKIVIINKCKICETPISRLGKICIKCNANNHKKFEVSKEELEELIKKYPILKIGKMFNVSDNAIRKRCISFGIEFKKKKDIL